MGLSIVGVSMKIHQVFPVVVAVAVGLVACGSGDGVGVGGSVAPLSSVSAPASSVGDPSGAWVLVSGPSDPIDGWALTV